MTRKIMNGLDFQGQRAQNAADPSSAQDLATKNYTDSLFRGESWHDSVIAASTANVSLVSAPASLDGVSLTANDRILLKNQTTASQNGIYVFASTGAALTLATDFASGTVLKTGATVSVEGGGTANGNSGNGSVWHITTPADGSITVGTTSTTWSQMGGGITYTAGNGISVTGTVIAAVANTGVTVTGSGIGADFAVVVKKFAANIGDGSTTAIVVTHNLGTRDIEVTVYDAATFDEVLADVNHTTTNTATITFAVAPASNAYRVVIQA